MSDPAPSAIEIRLDTTGRFQGVSLRESMLATAVRDGRQSWSDPLLLHGADTTADIHVLTSSSPDAWTQLRGFRDLSRSLRAGHRYEEIENRLDLRLYERAGSSTRSRLADLQAGRAPLDEIISFVLRGAAGDRSYSDPYLADDFLADLEKLVNTQGVIIAWPMRGSLLAQFVLAVWKRHPRLQPLILHSPRRFGIPGGSGIEIPTSTVSFSAMAVEVERAFKLKPGEVEKAYRVWQLSKSENSEQKPFATTPRAITMETAEAFLNVYTRARPDAGATAVAPQHAAPIIFELEEDAVGLRQGIKASDPQAVIASAASSLGRRVSRMQNDATFINVLPSASEILSVVERLLGQIANQDFGDGEIVELGLELNAFQWHVDAVRIHLSELSLGELTGLFATANLFLARFPTWLDYIGAQPAAGSPDDGVAAFSLARELLVSARERGTFLTPQANARISEVLRRTSQDEQAPGLREGLVRSGENLAAVTASGLSTVVVHEAKSFGKKIKDKGYDEASEAIVGFAFKNAPLLLKLGEARHWPWLKWLHELLT